MTRFITFCLTASILTTGLIGRPAVAETDMSRFPLAKAIPADVFMAVVERQNPERAFLDEYWAEVTRALMESGALTDVWDLISETVPEEGLTMFEENAERLCELSEKMDWEALFGKEFVYAGRLKFTENPSPYSGVLIGRSTKKEAEANYGVLKSILNELATETLKSVVGEGSATTAERTEDGVSISTLSFRDWPGMTINVAHWNDVIIIGFWDDSMLQECLALLRGSAKDKGLVETGRFKKAFAQLPEAEDTMFYFDVERLLATIRGLFSMLNQPPEKQKVQPVASEGPSAVKAVEKLIHDISVIDYVASVEWTDGYRVFSDTVTTLKADSKTSPVRKILTSGAPTDDFAKFIPKEAETFAVSSGINLSELYDYVINFIQKDVPDGKAHIEQFNAVQKEMEFNIKEDVLSLFSGSTVFATTGGEWMLMAKVTDAQKVDRQFDRLLAFIARNFGQENALIVEAVEVGATSKFKRISHPAMMMMPGVTPPVLGCAEGHLIIGSSSKAVEMCLKTARGDHPNIRKSKRWNEEALSPDGAVTSISFTDESKSAQELEAMLNSVSMALGMMGMFRGQMQGAPEGMDILMTGVPPILAKLAPVAGKINFYQSSASYETFDGDKWYSRDVQNYKKKSAVKKTEKKAEEKSEAASE